MTELRSYPGNDGASQLGVNLAPSSLLMPPLTWGPAQVPGWEANASPFPVSQETCLSIAFLFFSLIQLTDELI